MLFCLIKDNTLFWYHQIYFNLFINYFYNKKPLMLIRGFNINI